MIVSNVLVFSFCSCRGIVSCVSALLNKLKRKKIYAVHFYSMHGNSLQRCYLLAGDFSLIRGAFLIMWSGLFIIRGAFFIIFTGPRSHSI